LNRTGRRGEGHGNNKKYTAHRPLLRDRT
jgi:hypothetical protein